MPRCKALLQPKEATSSGPREGSSASEADFGLTDNVPMDKRKRTKIIRTDLPTDILRRLVLADKLSLTVSAMSKALDDPDMSEKAIKDAATLAGAVERANELYIRTGRTRSSQDLPAQQNGDRRRIAR